MKLVTYSIAGETSVGKVIGDQVVDLAAAFPGAPTSMLGILEGGNDLLARLDCVEPSAVSCYALADVRLEAPVPRPSKYLAIGLNYRDHLEEVLKMGGKAPEHKLWFNKQVSCITGPYDPIHLPRVSQNLDYEAELGVVIGKRCRHVKLDDALDVIAGYLVVDDVTARDWQRMTPTWTLGKSFDTHGPIGPWLVTADEIPDPQNLAMRLFVNGEIRQQISTGAMVYSIAEQIVHLSTVMTLEPGDILATGTCSGAGFGMKPPCFLQVGDVVRVEIDGIGHIENTVIAEPEAA